MLMEVITGCRVHGFIRLSLTFYGLRVIGVMQGVIMDGTLAIGVRILATMVVYAMGMDIMVKAIRGEDGRVVPLDIIRR